MGFDVLVFIIPGAYADPAKERVNDDGVNTSGTLVNTLHDKLLTTS